MKRRVWGEIRRVGRKLQPEACLSWGPLREWLMEKLVSEVSD